MVKHTAKEWLIGVFTKAIKESYPLVAVKIHMEGFPKDEIIINELENAEKKLEYYVNTYDDNLVHKHSSGIQIVDVDYADYVDELKWFREEK